MQKKINWLLVSDMRSILLKYWSPLVGLIVLIVVLQIILRRYEGEVNLPIMWLIICFGPGSLLLFGATWLNKFPKKIISPEAYRNLVGITLLHGLLALLSLLMFPFPDHQISAGTYLLKTLRWLSLTDFVLIIGYSIFFFRKESIILPNSEIIKQVATQESQKAARKSIPIRQQCLELVATGDLRNALLLTKEQVLNNDDKLHQVILLESRLSTIENQINTGTIEEDNAQMEINRISLALLNLSKYIR